MRIIIALVIAFILFGANSFLTYAIASPSTKFTCADPKSIDVGIEFTPDDLTDALSSAFRNNEFQSIQAAAKLWRSNDCLLDNGEYRIAYWLSGFTKYFNKNNDWKNSLQNINKYEAAYPESILPLLAESRYWSDYANHARGFGYASTVSEQNMKLFRERLLKSESILLSIRKKGSNWPQWYWQMIRVESLLERPRSTTNKYFFEGIKKFKNEYAIYTELSLYLWPRWGGSWTKVDQIVSTAVANIKREPPDAIYARMYWFTGDLIYPKKGFFYNSQVSWPRVRSGFIELMHLYPRSTLIENSFLSYACMFGDKSTYLKYRALSPGLDPKAWEGKPSRAACDHHYGFSN